jgi:outer membrane protein assembly factor BamB
VNGVSRSLVGAENKNGIYYAFDRRDLSAGPVWVYQAETTAVLNGRPCEDLNTISSSASAGPGTPVLVAGIGQSGSRCIGTLAALDPGTGTPIWQVPLPGVVQGAVTEVPGIVAVGAGTSLVVLSATTGATFFSFAEPRTGSYADNGFDQNYYYWAPPTISGKYLFIGNEDGSFRAFRV